MKHTDKTKNWTSFCYNGYMRQTKQQNNPKTLATQRIKNADKTARGTTLRRTHTFIPARKNGRKEAGDDRNRSLHVQHGHHGQAPPAAHGEEPTRCPHHTTRGRSRPIPPALLLLLCKREILPPLSPLLVPLGANMTTIPASHPDYFCHIPSSKPSQLSSSNQASAIVTHRSSKAAPFNSIRVR